MTYVLATLPENSGVSLTRRCDAAYDDCAGGGNHATQAAVRGHEIEQEGPMRGSVMCKAPEARWFRLPMRSAVRPACECRV